MRAPDYIPLPSDIAGRALPALGLGDRLLLRTLGLLAATRLPQSGGSTTSAPHRTPSSWSLTTALAENPF
jgi:hypothetical protein